MTHLLLTLLFMCSTSMPKDATIYEQTRRVLTHTYTTCQTAFNTYTYALHWAALYACPTLVAKLLENGAYVNAQSIHNFTPLHWATIHYALARSTRKKKQAQAVIQHLLDYNADPDATDIDGLTPLDWAGDIDPAAMDDLRLLKGAKSHLSTNR